MQKMLSTTSKSSFNTMQNLFSFNLYIAVLSLDTCADPAPTKFPTSHLITLMADNQLLVLQGSAKTVQLNAASVVDTCISNHSNQSTTLVSRAACCSRLDGADSRRVCAGAASLPDDTAHPRRGAPPPVALPPIAMVGCAAARPLSSRYCTAPGRSGSSGSGRKSISSGLATV